MSEKTIQKFQVILQLYHHTNKNLVTLKKAINFYAKILLKMQTKMKTQRQQKQSTVKCWSKPLDLLVIVAVISMMMTGRNSWDAMIFPSSYLAGDQVFKQLYFATYMNISMSSEEYDLINYAVEGDLGELAHEYLVKVELWWSAISDSSSLLSKEMSLIANQMIFGLGYLITKGEFWGGHSFLVYTTDKGRTVLVEFSPIGYACFVVEDRQLVFEYRSETRLDQYTQGNTSGSVASLASFIRSFANQPFDVKYWNCQKFSRAILQHFGVKDRYILLVMKINRKITLVKRDSCLERIKDIYQRINSMSKIIYDAHEQCLICSKYQK